jgi:hypothetical protein
MRIYPWVTLVNWRCVEVGTWGVSNRGPDDVKNHPPRLRGRLMAGDHF